MSWKNQEMNQLNDSSSFFYQSANNNIDEESYIERSLDFSVDISEPRHQFFPVEV